MILMTVLCRPYIPPRSLLGVRVSSHGPFNDISPSEGHEADSAYPDPLIR